MSITPVQTDQAPAAIGPYSQAVVVDKLLFVSGQIPLDPATGEIVEGSGAIADRIRSAKDEPRRMEQPRETLLDAKAAVIGVSKTEFLDDDVSIPVLRGESQQALYVTALGIDPKRAAELIENLHGRFRIPTLLKRVDRLGNPSTLATAG